MNEIRCSALAVLIATCAGAAGAQSFEYELRLLPRVTDSYSTIPAGLNDFGAVVGSTYGGDPLTVRAWVWTENGGLVVLPPPPGLSSYQAVDINNQGIVAGDGGYDWGEAWRFEEGVYEMLGTLPGDPMSTAAGINELGDVAGTSKSPSFTQPRNTYLAPASGDPLQLVLANSYASHLNDVGQVVGYATSQVAFRYSPGAGVEIIGPLGGRSLTWAWSINDNGWVVGAAALPSGNGHVPFLFTDDGGIQEIGGFGGGATASDVNNRGEVVGNFDASGQYPWIWTANTGVRFLNDLFDPNTNVRLLSAVRINEGGVILGHALNLSTGNRQPCLLVPAALFSDGFESGSTGAWLQ